MQNRPFENIQEMNQILIQNYNAVVHKNDTVYILGDISHHLPMDRANELISRLNGKKILIKGNHDKKDDLELFEEICDFKTVSLNGLYFALMYYPMLSWPKKNSGRFNYMDTYMPMKNIICRIKQTELEDMM